MRDQKLITLCNRLVEIEAEWNSVYGATDDEAEQDRLIAPLSDEMGRIECKLRKLGKPKTPAGVQAMARAALSLADKDPEGNVTSTDLRDWMAISVAQVVAEGVALET